MNVRAGARSYNGSRMKRERPPTGGYDPATHERVRVRRRAHWRVQRYGPDRALRRKVRIKAYYVLQWRQRSTNYELPLGIPEGDEAE